MKILSATLRDIPLIRQIAEEAFPATYRNILSKEQIDYMMEWMYSEQSLRRQMKEEAHAYFILFDESSAPCGYVSIRPEKERLYHLEKIYLLPSYQGKGYGTLLFSHAVDYVKGHCPGNAPVGIELNVNRHNPAYLFYRKMGMIQVREGDFEIGNGYYMNDYIMRLEVRREIPYTI